MSQLDASTIVELCLSKGFALAGISSATRSSHDVAIEQWLADGKQGEMEWMNRNIDVRLDSRNLLDGAKSVICVADRYSKLEELTLQDGHGRIARYARVLLEGRVGSRLRSLFTRWLQQESRLACEWMKITTTL